MSESILLDNNAILSKIIFEKKKNKSKSINNSNYTSKFVDIDEIEKNIIHDIEVDNTKLDSEINIPEENNN